MAKTIHVVAGLGVTAVVATATYFLLRGRKGEFSVCDYDSDGDEYISLGDYIDALADYYDFKITKEQVQRVRLCYDTGIHCSQG